VQFLTTSFVFQLRRLPLILLTIAQLLLTWLHNSAEVDLSLSSDGAFL